MKINVYERFTTANDIPLKVDLSKYWSKEWCVEDYDSCEEIE